MNKAKPIILIVEESLELLAQIREVLGEEYVLHAAQNLEEASDYLAQQSVSLVILDEELTGMRGADLFRHVRRVAPRVRIAMITESSNIRTAVQIAKMGAVEVFRKPLDPDHLRSAIAKFFAVMEEEGPDFSEFPMPEWMTGGSAIAARFRQEVTHALGLDQDILLVGPAGADRQSIIQLIHAYGLQKKRQLVRLDVRPFQKEPMEAHFWAALRELIQEPEMSGGEERGRCGTLVLFGLEEIPAHFQESIFHFLQDRFRTRGTPRGNSSARVVVELVEGLEEKDWNARGWASQFLRLELPTLSELKEDHLWILGALLEVKSRDVGRYVNGVEKEVLEFFGTNHFQGNLRELSNYLQRAVLWSNRDIIGMRDIPVTISSWLTWQIGHLFDAREWNLGRALEKFRQRLLKLLYQKSDGDVERLAIFLDIPKGELQGELLGSGMQ